MLAGESKEKRRHAKCYIKPSFMESFLAIPLGLFLYSTPNDDLCSNDLFFLYWNLFYSWMEAIEYT